MTALNQPILGHKLIVPLHMVPLNAYDHFKVVLKNEDDEPVDYVFYVIDYENGVVHFDRGDLSLIYKLFGHLPIQDQRSNPMMNSAQVQTSQGLGLTFTKTLKSNQEPVVNFLVNGDGYGQLKAHPRFGKTVVMTAVSCALKRKTLFLSHQIDLANQVYDKFLNMTNMSELEEKVGRKVVGIVDKWQDLLDLDVAIMPYQKFVSGKGAAEWLLRLRNQFGVLWVDECFEYSTPVTLSNGLTMPIGQLVQEVRSGITHYVRSFNPETSSWEDKMVSGFHESPNLERWLRVQIGDSDFVTCTPNHGWYLDGYRKVRAEELKVGDSVIVYPGPWEHHGPYRLEPVTGITEVPVDPSNPMRYNIRVEDHHNYLVGACPALVSNCHKTKADRYSGVISSFNARYRHGVSGTTELKNNKHLLNTPILGPVVVEGHGDQIPATVYVYETKKTVPLRPGKMFFTMMENLFAQDEGRNRFMLDVVLPWLRQGHSVILVSSRVRQIEWFTEQIKKEGFTAGEYHSKAFKNDTQREDYLEKVRSGEIQAMVAMRSMVLGLDVPRLTAFFNLMPTSHPQNYFQEICRVRTPYEIGHYKKEMGYIIDFRDNNHILEGCYKTRRRVYAENGFTIYDNGV